MKCKKILSVIFIMVLGIFGCESKDNNEELYRSIYEKTDKSPKMDSLEVKQEIINCFEEKGYAAVDVENQIGFRVKPLDQTCRELNRKYVMPVGYERNKLLITDWNEQDYTNLDFYDLYEVMYRMKYGEDVPYESDYHGAEHEIPKKEFEEVLKTYLQIDSDAIKQNTVYNESSQTYRYRPRGLYDCEFPYGPYPEVTDYEERNDGTIKLTVNAVWIMEKQDSAITSELVVRPLENGGFQYVSNRVISQTDGIETKWYKERLSDSEWDEHYKEEE